MQQSVDRVDLAQEPRATIAVVRATRRGPAAGVLAFLRLAVEVDAVGSTGAASALCVTLRARQVGALAGGVATNAVDAGVGRAAIRTRAAKLARRAAADATDVVHAVRIRSAAAALRVAERARVVLARRRLTEPIGAQESRAAIAVAGAEVAGVAAIGLAGQRARVASAIRRRAATAAFRVAERARVALACWHFAEAIGAGEARAASAVVLAEVAGASTAALAGQRAGGRGAVRRRRAALTRD